MSNKGRKAATYVAMLPDGSQEYLRSYKVSSDQALMAYRQGETTLQYIPLKIVTERTFIDPQVKYTSARRVW